MGDCAEWEKEALSSFNETVGIANETNQKVLDDCGEAIKALKSFAEHDAEFIVVNRVVPAGSYGRSTMVRGSFDVDLLVFVNRYNGEAIDWKDGVQQLMNMRSQVKKLLKTRGHEVEVHDGHGYEGALKLDLPISPGLPPVHVDLMLLPNMAGGYGGSASAKAAWLQYKVLALPLYEKPETLLLPDPTREAALSEALMELVKGKHDQVKGVVRFIKAWYKYGLEANDVVQHVPSVLLEVVVLAASQNEAAVGQVPKTSGGNKKSETRKFQRGLMVESLRLLQAAARGSELVVVEKRTGDEWGYTRDVANRCTHVWGQDPVVVLHPIDPTCNIAKPRLGKPTPDWNTLAEEAERLHTTLCSGASVGDLLREETAFARTVSTLEALEGQSQRAASATAGSPDDASTSVSHEQILDTPGGDVCSRVLCYGDSPGPASCGGGDRPGIATGPPRPVDRARPAASSMMKPTGSYAGSDSDEDMVGDLVAAGLAAAAVFAVGGLMLGGLEALLAPPPPPPPPPRLRGVLQGLGATVVWCCALAAVRGVVMSILSWF